MVHPNDIITDADKQMLADAYNEMGLGEGPYQGYARLALEGRGSFTLCSLRAIARARIAASKTIP